MFIDFRERGREGRTESEGEEHLCERKIDQLPPVQASTRDQTYNFLVHGMTLHPTEPPGQGLFYHFLISVE